MSVGVLIRVFPPGLVDNEVIAAAGRTEQRHRSLPARVMAYFVIGMGLYTEGSYEDVVLSQLTDGLSWASGWEESFTLPSKSAIFQARARLGSKPLEALFARVAKPSGTPGMHGVCLAVDDSRRAGGWWRSTGAAWTSPTLRRTQRSSARPGVNKGEKSAFPQARLVLVALADCGGVSSFPCNGWWLLPWYCWVLGQMGSRSGNCRANAERVSSSV